MVQTTFYSLLLALPLQTAAFLRTDSKTPTMETDYAQYGPTVNLSESMLIGYDDPVQSYWYASYLAAENGHNYFSIACNSLRSGGTNSYILLVDLNTTEYFGTNIVEPASFTKTSYKWTSKGLTLGASSEDLVSEQLVESKVPEAAFKLTVQPRGPALYHGGSGTHWWGNGTTNQWAFPQLWTTGTITINGTETTVIPEKSLTWLDRQWGKDTQLGWTFFTFYLDNGLVIAVWRILPNPGDKRIHAWATVQYPDGHHEIHTINPDIQASDPFVSEATNTTYYARHKLLIPTLDAEFSAHMPIKVGEMAAKDNPSEYPFLFEGYTEFTGTVRGAPVTGFGLTEIVIAT